MKKLLNLLKGNFTKRSARALSSFNEALKELRAINREIDIECTRKRSEIVSLETTMAKNTKLINKINDFLS